METGYNVIKDHVKNGYISLVTATLKKRRYYNHFRNSIIAAPTVENCKSGKSLEILSNN
jgi:hypothetical protein